MAAKYMDVTLLDKTVFNETSCKTWCRTEPCETNGLGEARAPENVKTGTRLSRTTIWTLAPFQQILGQTQAVMSAVGSGTPAIVLDLTFADTVNPVPAIRWAIPRDHLCSSHKLVLQRLSLCRRERTGSFRRLFGCHARKT